MKKDNNAAESPFLRSLLATDAEEFDCPIEHLCEGRSLDELLDDCEQLESFWKSTNNLYLRVRALIFLYYIHRFVLRELTEGRALSRPVENCQTLKDGTEPVPPVDRPNLSPVPIPLEPHRAIQARNFSEAIDLLLKDGRKARLNRTLSSGLDRAA